MNNSSNKTLVRTLQNRLGIKENIYVNDTFKYPVHLIFTIKSTQWNKARIEDTLVKIYQRNTGVPLSIHLKNRLVMPSSHWENPASAYLTNEAYGLLTFLYSFGAMQSDGVDVVFKLVSPNGIQLTTWLGSDYCPDTLTFRINGTNQSSVDEFAAEAKAFFT